METLIEKILGEMIHGDWKNWYSSFVGRGANFSEAFYGYMFLLNAIPVEREFIIEPYPIDYAIPRVKLAIEIDSYNYRTRGGKGSRKHLIPKKDAYLRGLGWEVHHVIWWKDPFGRDRERTASEMKKVFDILENMNVVE